MSNISEEDRKRMDLSLRYNLDMDSIKMEAYLLFEEGYQPKQVIYALRPLDADPRTSAFERTIRRYYYGWKKAQK